LGLFFHECGLTPKVEKWLSYNNPFALCGTNFSLFCNYQTRWIMASYLLLRNNKESGPYSVDDLMELGLKPYDLVWVKGKSAAWRYPSEVDELKPIAPVVEEQPYDRFYKKAGDEKKEEAPRQEARVVLPEHEKYIPKKSVFVTMPGGQKAVVSKQMEEERPAIKENKYIPPVTETAQQTITISENPAAAQIKYSQPLDEIKEMYVKTLNNRKQKIARKSFWLQNLKKAAALLSLVAVGLIAGFVIKSNGNKRQEIVQKEAQPPKTVTAPLVSLTDTTTNATAIQDDQASVPTVKNSSVHMDFSGEEKAAEVKQPAESKRTTDQAANNALKKETPLILSENEATNSLVNGGVEIDPATGERSRKVRNGNTRNNNTAVVPEERSTHGSELSSMVSVTTNEYKKVAFGGIRDLQLTVTNESKYTLDNVIVELQYLKPSEQPLRTENIQFKAIGPKTSSTIRVPDTNRGIKIVYRIINIKSRQMDEGVAGN
jgi:hypothetical protein